MEGKLVFLFLPVNDIKSAKTLYRDVLGLEEAWREGESTIAFQLPNSDVQLMVEQVAEGGPAAPGPVFLVPSVMELYNKLQGKLKFVHEPAPSPDGLWVSAVDDSGNGLYFTDVSGEE